MMAKVPSSLNLEITIMKNNLDCLLIHSDSAKRAYQSLSGKYSAIDPPTWSLLLAESCRANDLMLLY